MKPINKNFKRGAVAIGLMVTLFLGVSTSFLTRTTVIPNLNTGGEQVAGKIRDADERNNTVEGAFIDRNGFFISQEEFNKKGVARPISYHKEAFSHIIGYNSKRMGLSGLRYLYQDELYYGSRDKKGANITLTLDAELQVFCHDLLKKQEKVEGSIVVIDNDTKEILALASRSDAKVDYIVNDIDKRMSKYNNIHGYHYNRATSNFDAIGSVQKIVTSLSMIENGISKFTYDDREGVYEADGVIIHNYNNQKGTKKLTLQNALIKSTNTYFAAATVEKLGLGAFRNTAKRFMLGKKINLDFCTLKSEFDLTDRGDATQKELLAQTAFGQGRTSLSPLQTTMLMSALMNEGEMYKPHLISRITDNSKKIVYEAEKAEKISQVGKKKDIKTLNKMLNKVAKSYGFNEKEFGKVYAKTGTADMTSFTNAKKKNAAYILIGVEKNDRSYSICISARNTDRTGGSFKKSAEKILKKLDYT